MSRARDYLCAHCLEPVPYGGPSVMPLEIIESRCAVTLRWHMACAHVDTLFAALADGLETQAPPGADRDPFQDAYHAVLDRTAQAGVELLPRVADVRRDIDEIQPNGGRVTLRAPGRNWGRPTLVLAASVKRWPR
jgi:hypothetical protein